MAKNDNRSDKEPKSSVDRERAMQHALLTIRRLWAGGSPDFEGWGSYLIDPDPLIIHDMNGKILFYEYDVLDGERVVGAVKTSASRMLGSPVPVVEFGSRGWDPDSAAKEAQKMVQKEYSTAEILGTELVCYSYPKIGVRVDFDQKKIGRQSLIFDGADLTPIDRVGSDEPEGMTAYSFYHEIAEPNALKRERRWNLADEELDAAISVNDNILTQGFTEGELPAIKINLIPVTEFVYIPFFSSHTIRYGPRCSPHECFELYAQQTNVFCAVATGQMILDFYRYYHTQDEIATAMSTGAFGTTNPNQVTGYQDISNNCLTATYDGTANWAEAKTEIDANRPLKSGIPGHARACAGWMRQNIYFVGQQPRRWLKIYDPWPWNADICQGGKIVWEDWETVTHTNFIYIRHRTTTCS